ncbi:hypothetical protein KAFR_0C06120 [Kazachstania africana CBS 2517]|uniref:Sphingoid long-chain base transporter RSB1 n=1 Tax=Kazachstania africana (strain ATCC 22294 / BCRC 22015 / CBS 2517 / CECT 1963 / NBRC 1671 / NRRL Y-8276) TaxID=1071382 RepID=H2ATA4_KAZAF|nr:hypothetical protein KAFR_0C06120 [Kazachstania africana CBS 2517]CCF57604.1 hypothetical protein KAFR_0C06120 [Kazachstania africana CBS 2517]
MVPNLGFNASMIGIWGALLLAQIAQLYFRQYWFSVSFICTGILEVIGYIGRTMNHFNVANRQGYLLNMICLTISPVFTMAGIYYQLAKLIEVYGHRFALLGSPMAYSYVFITSDIISLVVQAIGGGVAASATSRNTSSEPGKDIFIAGLALQVVSMIIFITFWFHFLYKIYIGTRKEHDKNFKISDFFKISQNDIDYLYREKYHDLRINPSRWPFKYFTLSLTATVLLIFTRCVYRLAELSYGWLGKLVSHEWYFIALDCLMMTISTVIMTVIHPGLALQGRYVSIPITKGRVDPELLEGTLSENRSSSTASMSTELKVPIVEDSKPNKLNFSKKVWSFKKK